MFEFKINKTAFESFLVTAASLNEIGVKPILYGSLGLNRVIGEFCSVNDIDVLIPEEFLGEKWPEILKLMENLGFKLTDEQEHEFSDGDNKISFGREGDLVDLSKIEIRKLKNSKIGEANFKELSPEQYLAVYQLMLRDGYRQEKRGLADKEKILKIKEFILKNTHEDIC